jgi:hypothetical protein
MIRAARAVGPVQSHSCRADRFALSIYRQVGLAFACAERAVHPAWIGTSKSDISESLRGALGSLITNQKARRHLVGLYAANSKTKSFKRCSMLILPWTESPAGSWR